MSLWAPRRGGAAPWIPPHWGPPAMRVVLVVAGGVGVSARREDRAPDPPQQRRGAVVGGVATLRDVARPDEGHGGRDRRSEEHTSELQSLAYLVCRLLLEKKKQRTAPCIRVQRTSPP